MSPQKTQYLPYYRVSTLKQGQSGLGLEAQRDTVEAFVLKRGGIIATPMSDAPEDIKASGFVEVESGRKNKRPKLAEALEQCEMTGATLVVAKLDRLSRNLAFITQLKESGADFIAADLPDMNTMNLGIMATMAQYEAEVISARTKVALQASQRRRERARADGDLSVKLLGGYRANAADISQFRDAGEEAAKAKADKAAERCRKAIQMLARKRKTLDKMAEYLNEQGILSPRSKKNRIDPSLSVIFKWHPMTVKRVMKRLGIERPATA